MPNAKGTTNTPIRFTEGDRVLIEELRTRHGFKSLAETIRYALRITDLVDKRLVTTDDAPAKKSQKKSQEVY